MKYYVKVGFECSSDPQIVHEIMIHYPEEFLVQIQEYRCYEGWVLVEAESEEEAIRKVEEKLSAIKEKTGEWSYIVSDPTEAYALE